MYFKRWHQQGSTSSSWKADVGPTDSHHPIVQLSHSHHPIFQLGHLKWLRYTDIVLWVSDTFCKLVVNQVQNLVIAKTKIEFWNRNWIVYNSILTAAYEFKTDVCTHALSCNARLSAMVLQWPCRCKVSSFVVYSFATCLQDTVCRLQYQYSWTRLYDCVTFVICDIWHSIWLSHASVIDSNLLSFYFFWWHCIKFAK